MAAKKKPAPAPEGTPLRGDAAWQAAKKRVADANEAGYALDRAKRDVSEARSARARTAAARLEDADIRNRS